MCGLCGFLYKDAERHGPVGRVMFDMLTPLDRRGTDSTGVALYGEPKDGTYVLRVRMEANGSTPEHVNEALEAAGTVSEAGHTGGNFRARIGYDGDLGDLTDRVEQVPGTEVFSIGRSMEIVKDVGDASDVERAAPYSGFEGSHAIGHTRMATESLVDVAHSHPFWARPFPDISVVHNGHITNYHRLRRQYEQRGHRFFTENDSEVIGVYLRDRLAKGLSLANALRSSLDDFDGSFSYLAADGDCLAYVRDRYGFKPVVVAETPEFVAIATEEIALRRALGHEFVAREPAPGTMRVWSAGTKQPATP